MVVIIVQYVLLVLLVAGLGYLAYLLKDRDINIKDDYFGFDYVILGSLDIVESTSENSKKILRIVSKAVQYVETNYGDSENNFKEEEAIKLVKDSIISLNLKNSIDKESLKYLVRLAAALLPPTNKIINWIIFLTGRKV